MSSRRSGRMSGYEVLGPRYWVLGQRFRNRKFLSDVQFAKFRQRGTCIMGKTGFQTLVVWQRAKKLAVEIYMLTRSGLFVRDFGLRDQIRRAAVSIASNIAEGDERTTNKDSIRFFGIARGSTAELRTQLAIAHDVGYIDKPEYLKLDNQCIEIGKMLGGLIKARTIDAPI